MLTINFSHNNDFYYGKNFFIPKLERLTVNDLVNIIKTLKDEYGFSIDEINNFDTTAFSESEFLDYYITEEMLDSPNEIDIDDLLKALSVLIGEGSDEDSGFSLAYFDKFTEQLTVNQLIELLEHLAYPYVPDDYMWWALTHVEIQEVAGNAIVKWETMGGDADQYHEGSYIFKLKNFTVSFDNIDTVGDLISVLEKLNKNQKIKFTINSIGGN